MSDAETRRALALVRLRRQQTSFVTALRPDLVTARARPTSRVGSVPADGGGEYVVQRLRVEFPRPEFGADELRGAAAAVLDPDGVSVVLPRDETPGRRPRVDVVTPCGTVHSAALLHGGRVLQLTSFGGPIDDGDDDAVDDTLQAEETLAAPPEELYGTVDPEAAERDPRRLALDHEEEELGPDYGYVLLIPGGPGR